jgi:DUF4097 and DUF4098 domain-containing protein YvlB
MSWFLSVIISGLIFTAPGNLSNFLTENFVRGNVPQVVVLTPQTVIQGDETERLDKTFPLNPNGRISLSNVNGSITVEAWDRNEVKLEALKVADSKERLSQVEIKIDATSDYLKISTEYGDWRNGQRTWNCNKDCRLEVQYKLMVPRNAVLNEIETVNGSVTISNTANITNASAVNGNVKATNLRGTAKIETVNGISEVDFDSIANDGKITLSTVNGKVNLLLPSDIDATLKADTVNGSISNEFGLPIRKGKYVGRDLYGKIGDGKVRINLESVNGGLNIKRKQDGKNIKNVTNLLNMSADSDNEDDIDVDVDVNVDSVAKINKTIAKSVKESTKIAVEQSLKLAEQAPIIAEQALKDAEIAMKVNAKEIEKAQREAERTQRAAQRDAERLGREFARTYGEAFQKDWAANFGGFSGKRIEEQSNTFEVKGTPKVTVDAKNCDVSVRGWDRQEVKYRVTKLMRGAAQPNVDVKVNNTDTEVVIRALNAVEKAKISKDNFEIVNVNAELDNVLIPNAPGNVKIEVFVPKKSNLRILTDREIRVEGISGNIDLKGNEGAINVRDSGGKLNINAATALVRVIGFSGEVDSKTSNGTNFFEGDFVKFFAQTVEGKIILTLPEDANVDIQANTKIHTEGFDLKEFNASENRRRIGEGGTTFLLNADQGEILVRSSKVLTTK